MTNESNVNLKNISDNYTNISYLFDHLYPFSSMTWAVYNTIYILSGHFPLIFAIRKQTSYEMTSLKYHLKYHPKYHSRIHFEGIKLGLRYSTLFLESVVILTKYYLFTIIFVRNWSNGIKVRDIYCGVGLNVRKYQISTIFSFVMIIWHLIETYVKNLVLTVENILRNVSKCIPFNVKTWEMNFSHVVLRQPLSCLMCIRKFYSIIFRLVY